MPKTICIVVPCFQSEENIPELDNALGRLYAELCDNYLLQVVLVDDGSTDRSLELMYQMKQRAPYEIIIVKLSGNFGSYNAFLAGLHQGSGDAYIQLHSDLQDPPEHIPEMIRHWENGYKMVIGLRISREEPFFQRTLSGIYHSLIKKFALNHIPEGGYDLILFDKQLRDHVVEINETNTNLVYLISWLKFPYITIPITRIARTAGKSQWTASKKIKLFIDSFVAFSYTPIRLITLLAILSIPLVTLGLISLCYSNISTSEKILFSGLYLIGVFILISLSVIAEYIYRTLEASRKRPPFVIDKIIK